MAHPRMRLGRSGAHQPARSRRAFSALVQLDSLQARDGRAVADLAVGQESGAVAGAVPGPLRVVPVDLASHVRTDGRDADERAGLVARDGHLLAVDLHDLTPARADVAEGRGIGPR